MRRAQEKVARREKQTEAQEAANRGAGEPIDLRAFTAANEFEDIPDPEPAPGRAREQTLIPPAEKLTPEEIGGEHGRGKRKERRIRPEKKKRRGFIARTFPQRGDKKSEVARKVIRIVSFVILVAALLYIAVYGVKYAQRKQQTRDFSERIDEIESEKLSEQALADLWKDIRAQYPDVEYPEGMQVKFSHLYAINNEFVGWLKIGNTNIVSPLLQRPNDNYYYLYHDIYKKSSRYGNPYIHCDCSMGPEGLSRNTIIYGHNTHDGLMFHQLTNYMTRDGYLNAPIITMDTLYETTKWKIFAVMLTNSTPEADNGYVFDYLYPEFSSDEAFMSKIRQIQRRSMIHTGVDVEAGDKIITLYTCYQNIFKGGRLVILGRMLREGESEAINPAEVYYDENAIFPRAYYSGGYDEEEDGAAEVNGGSAVQTQRAAEGTAAETPSAPTEAGGEADGQTGGDGQNAAEQTGPGEEGSGGADRSPDQ